MTRAEALRRVAELQHAWSLEWGDRITAPADATGDDVPEWSAEVGATAAQQDDLNAAIAELLAQIED